MLGRFVREKQLFPLEEAIRKMTSLPARRVGLSDRGTIAAGMKADLVLFDPATVIDRSTFEEPRKLVGGHRLGGGEWPTGLGGRQVDRRPPRASPDREGRVCVCGGPALESPDP